MPTTKIPKCEYEKIINMNLGRMKHKDIAKIYDVNPSTITDILIRCGIRSNTSNNTPIPESAHDDIIKLYADGNSQEVIAKIYNTSQKNVGNILKRHNVQCRHQPLNFTEDEVMQMYEMYCNRITTDEIGAQYNISRDSVYNLFEKYNLQIREFADSRREYNLNVHYFDEINTPNKAYILGLLYADGCNKRSKYQIDLSLQECDKHILEDISKEIETDKPLQFKPYKDKNPNHKDQYKLSITNKHVSDVLCEIGMVNAKSLVLEFPESLNEELYPHFIRGYFDGDGCLYLGKNGRNPEVSIVSTIMFIEKVKDILDEKLGISMKIKSQKQYKPVTKIGLITGRNKIALFLNWIYQDADLKLNRKYQKYLQLMESYKNIDNSCSN